MDYVRKFAEERAARPSSVPAGSSFESERQKQKAALVRQIDELDGSKIRKISAASEKAESNKTLRVAAYCRVSTDDIDQAISIELQMRQYKDKIKAIPHNYCRADAQSDFLSDCIKILQAYWRMSKDFCVI